MCSCGSRRELGLPVIVQGEITNISLTMLNMSSLKQEHVVSGFFPCLSLANSLKFPFTEQLRYSINSLSTL